LDIEQRLGRAKSGGTVDPETLADLGRVYRLDAGRGRLSGNDRRRIAGIVSTPEVWLVAEYVDGSISSANEADPDAGLKGRG